MASTTPQAKDSTFRSYSSLQAKLYATHRLSYEASIYDTVLSHHSSTGGQFGLLIDVGCGPGNATRDVALSFDEAIGVDPGASMIDTAREIGGKTKAGKEIRYEVSGAEEISNVKGVEGKVDLLISAMAAHWFEMDGFWREAAKVVKPGGTVALWTLASAFCHPNTPNASKVLEVFLRFERETLAPYTLPGNITSMNMYDDLDLPWSIPSPVSAFHESSFVRLTYDRDGILSNGKSFFGGEDECTLDEMEKRFNTASMVTRWREANPELAGTDKDVVKLFVNELREALPADHQKVVQGAATAILLFTRSTD